MATKKKCEICNEAQFKYECPKCGILFCSVPCYKNVSHQECSEQFYKKCVEEELELRKAESGSFGMQKDEEKMYKILQNSVPEDADMNTESGKSESEESGDEEIDSDDDEDETATLGERMEGVNLEDPEEVWLKLTDAERREFEDLLVTGEIAKIMPKYSPWWEKKIAIELVTDLNEEGKSTQGEQQLYPEIFKNIPNFENVAKKPPSECVYNNLFNVLAAYACAVHFFDGEHYTPDAATYICYTSLNLRANTNFDDKIQSIHSVLNECTSIGCLPIPVDGFKVITTDLSLIVEGRYTDYRENVYMLSALSDMHKVFSNTLDDLKKNQQSAGESVPQSVFYGRELPDSFQHLSKSKIRSVLKKIEYYLSLVNNYDLSQLSLLT